MAILLKNKLSLVSRVRRQAVRDPRSGSWPGPGYRIGCAIRRRCLTAVTQNTSLRVFNSLVFLKTSTDNLASAGGDRKAANLHAYAKEAILPACLLHFALNCNRMGPDHRTQLTTASANMLQQSMYR